MSTWRKLAKQQLSIKEKLNRTWYLKNHPVQPIYEVAMKSTQGVETRKNPFLAFKETNFKSTTRKPETESLPASSNVSFNKKPSLPASSSFFFNKKPNLARNFRMRALNKKKFKLSRPVKVDPNKFPLAQFTTLESQVALKQYTHEDLIREREVLQNIYGPIFAKRGQSHLFDKGWALHISYKDYYLGQLNQTDLVKNSNYKVNRPEFHNLVQELKRCKTIKNNEQRRQATVKCIQKHKDQLKFLEFSHVSKSIPSHLKTKRSERQVFNKIVTEIHKKPEYQGRVAVNLLEHYILTLSFTDKPRHTMVDHNQVLFPANTDNCRQAKVTMFKVEN